MNLFRREEYIPFSEVKEVKASDKRFTIKLNRRHEFADGKRPKNVTMRGDAPNDWRGIVVNMPWHSCHKIKACVDGYLKLYWKRQ